MKFKFLLPVLAAIFAIGMSFTTLNEVGDPNTDYIQLEDGSFEPIGVELECGEGTKNCQVLMPGETIPRNVYNAPNTSSLKKGDGDVREL